MVSDESLYEIIRWETPGTSFVILQPDKLAPTLALHFKHRKFSSFVRQLNMYNFKKVGTPKQWEFYHDAFRRGKTNLLRYIKRKKSTPSTKSKLTQGLKSEVIGLKNQRDNMQHDIDMLTEQQCDLEVQLAQIMEENSDLRTELSASKQSHENMRRCVDQIMTFVSAALPDHDLSELTALLNACPAPTAPAAIPALPVMPAIRPRDASDESSHHTTEEEPPRKRRKVEAEDETPMLCASMSSFGPRLKSVKQEECLPPPPLLSHKGADCMAWRDTVVTDMNLFDFADVDDAAVPSVPTVGDSFLSRSQFCAAPTDLLSAILHS
jgi:hypothetical protein